MGLNLSWLAVQSSDEAELLDRLDLEVVGEATSALNLPQAMIRLPSGWLLIVSEGHRIGYDGLGGAVSLGRQAITGFMSETVMASSLHGFCDGKQVWSVVRNPDADPDDVEVKGSPPEIFADVWDIGAKRQADEPFEVPQHLMTALTGFAPFGDLDEGIWLVLAQPKKGRRGEQNALFSQRIPDEVLKDFLEEYGWSLLTERPTLPHRPQRFEIVRQRPHGLELMGLLFVDTGDEITAEINFYVGDGDPEKMRLVLEGKVEWSKEPFWSRVLGWGEPKASRDEMLFRLPDRLRYGMIKAQWVLDKNYHERRTKPPVKITGGVAKATWPHVPPLGAQ